MQIEISTRHGTLGSAQHAYLLQKAEKLQKYFGRLMSIEVEAEPIKHEWLIGIYVSAEHKHDFIAKSEGPTPETAMDSCVHKVEEQLRRYKDQVQKHHGDIPQGGTSPKLPDLPEGPRLI